MSYYRDIVYVVIILVIVYLWYIKNQSNNLYKTELTNCRKSKLTCPACQVCSTCEICPQNNQKIDDILGQLKSVYRGQNPDPKGVNDQFMMNIEQYFRSAEQIRTYIKEKFGYPDLMVPAVMNTFYPNSNVYEIDQALQIIKNKL